MVTENTTPALSPAECVAEIEKSYFVDPAVLLNDEHWLTLKSHITAMQADLARLREPVVEWEMLHDDPERLILWMNKLPVASILYPSGIGNVWGTCYYIERDGKFYCQSVGDEVRGELEFVKSQLVVMSKTFYAAFTGQGRVEG